jgi:hypothetical protein
MGREGRGRCRKRWFWVHGAGREAKSLRLRGAERANPGEE